MIELDEVRLVDVSRHFGRRRAVAHVSLTLRAGDLLGLLGPNGSGKSTLLGILGTLVAPTAGAVRYGGHELHASGASVRRQVGLLAHELHLYPELTARQNLSFFARLYGLEAAPVVDRALESAGLADRGGDPIAEFSRGMRQRLALERALLHSPRLVLMDEPFTGLDDRAVGLVAERLRRLAGSGAIVVVATHDLHLADGLVSRMALLRDGRLLCDEPAGAALRERYRDLMAAPPDRESLRSSARSSASGSGAPRA
jgi:heme exporter protein A